ALADRVLILEAGRITQAGTLAEVTSRPRSRYVADLIGVNLLHGVAAGTAVALVDHPGTVVVASSTDGPVLLLIHPHSVTLHEHRSEGSARNQWQGTIEGFDLLGDRVRVRLGGAVPLSAEVTPAAVADLGLAEGRVVWATVKATDVTAYPA
ncbi:MAG: transporter ATP-binding protein, partial [Acidimicrobiales bacterium]|nr:transporter ATP-binding protein [Acidimicrobiales bacterium]